MPMYFFESDDGDLFVSDDVGSRCADDTAARAVALRALSDMARDKIPDGEQQVFTIRVMNGGHDLIYKGTMTVEGGWAASGSGSAGLHLVQ